MLPIQFKYCVDNIFQQVVASHAPDSSDSVVAARIKYFKKSQLAFCRSKDESWTLIQAGNAREKSFCSIASHHNKLYAVDECAPYAVMVFDLGNGRGVTVERIIMFDPRPRRPRAGLPRSLDRYILNLGYEYVCIGTDPVGGDVFLVFEVRDVRRKRGGCCVVDCSTVKRCSLFKLDMSGPRWIQVDDLGDRLLFVDSRGVKLKVISATTLENNAAKQEFFCRNSLYFARTCVSDPEREIYWQDITVFCLTDQTIKPLVSNQNSTLRFSDPCLWFTPNP